MRQTRKVRNIRSMIGFELFLKTTCLSFSFLLIPRIFDFCLWASGYSYVTKENAIEFFLSPCVLLFLITGFVMLSLFLLWEMNAVCVAIRWKNSGKRISFSTLVFESINETVREFRNIKKGIYITGQCVVFVGLLNVPGILFVLLGVSRTGSVLVEQWGVIRIFFACMGALACMVLGFRIQKMTLRKIVKRGFFLPLAEGICYIAGIIVLIVTVCALTEKPVSGIILLRWFERYHLLCGIIFISVNTVVYEWLCMEVILKQECSTFIIAEEIKERSVSERTKRIYLWFICIAVFVTATTQCLSFVRNRSVRFSRALEEIGITAHRGASGSAPENTAAAIELAIREGADYAEIDVRLTGDGVPVLLHDRNLFRTTGVAMDVDRITYESLSFLLLGEIEDVSCSEEPVPRLSDILDRFGGKIGFNLDLKTKDAAVVEKVISLIEKFGLEESCKISSDSYEQLEMVKERNKQIETGYILSMIYGDFYESEAADFFSVRAGYITETMIKQAHARGKEIHGWTVNHGNEVKRLKTMGVDHIITDRPEYVRSVIKESDLAETIEEWLSFLTAGK